MSIPLYLIKEIVLIKSTVNKVKMLIAFAFQLSHSHEWLFLTRIISKDINSDGRHRTFKVLFFTLSIKYFTSQKPFLFLHLIYLNLHLYLYLKYFHIHYIYILLILNLAFLYFYAHNTNKVDCLENKYLLE